MSEKVVTIAFCGDSAAGKTSLIYRIVHGTFNPEHCSTIAVDVVDLDWFVEGSEYHLKLIDTVGQDKSFSIPPALYRDCHWVFLCCDPGMDGAEERLKEWRNVYDQRRPADSKVMLVLTKYDSWEQDEDEVKEEGRALQSELQADGLWLTSSKTGRGVADLFTYAVMERPIRETKPELDPTPEVNIDKKDQGQGNKLNKCCT